MWAAYAPGGESVAIVSTYRSLSLCLEDAQAIFQLRPGVDGKPCQTTVEDYDFDQISITRSSQPPGIAVNVKMEDLVEQVRVAPNATDWFTFAVQEACSRFGLSKDIVKRSDITSERFS